MKSWWRWRVWWQAAQAVDRLNDRIGHAMGWLTLAMVLIGSGNALARHAGRFFGWNLSSNAYLELQWYLFSLVFLLAGAYALKRGAHVRVDVFYERLTPRGRAWVNLLGHLLFLLPFSLFMLWVSWPTVRNSWAVRENSPDPGGLPRYPLKTMILVGFALLLLQGVAEVVKQVRVLRGEAPEALGEPEKEWHA